MKRFLIAAVLSITALTACAGEPPKVGAAAPGFKLQDQNGEWHELNDFSGKWLAIYFYPKDDTPGCTTEACNFRDNIYAFKAIGAEVVGISVDDVESHKKFATKYKLPFTLLADVGGAVSDAYGVLVDYKMMKIASRQSFLVGPDGVIVKHYAEVNPEDHTQEVLSDIEQMSAGGQAGGP
jgi:peroxiredoxin Q/BCP